MRYLAWLLALLALASALLAAAPFPAAIFLFGLYLPVSAICGHLGHKRPALVTLGSFVLALVLSPVWSTQATFGSFAIAAFSWLGLAFIAALILTLRPRRLQRQ